ncbi:hypothetical protein F0U59_09730 [Archangium gephyra]|nr:hypothetical protein F0U59_09730 [Archangium gephyra]
MKMKGQRTRVIGAITWLLVSGCQTPGAVGAGSLSASNSDSGSGASSNTSGNSSESNSGNSSDSNSGNSSDSNSGDSSQSQSSESSQGPSSESNSGNSGEGEASQSQSGGSSENSQSSRGGNVVSFSVVGATLGGLGLAFWMIMKAPSAGPPPPVNVGEAAQAYLRARTHQLREDLALGAGPSIEDLAAMARIRRENLRIFGRVLREHRRELLALAESSALTPEHALEWLARVGQLARTEQRLEEDRLAFLAAYGVLE